MPVPGTAATPETVDWTLRNPRTKEVRHYEQNELTIEGEARLIGILRTAAVALREHAFTWPQLESLFDEGPFQYDLALDLVGAVTSYAPDLLVDAALVFVGVFPTDENGQPNAEYEQHRTFVKGSLKIAMVVDMIRTFAAQNDIARMLAPFSSTLAGVLGSAAQPTQAPDAPVDGSPAPAPEPAPAFDPWVEPSPASSPAEPPSATIEALPSETATPSEPSPT
jgi:hypothetical protein